MNDTARGSLAFVIVALLAFGLWSLVAAAGPPLAEGSAVRWERSELMAGEIAGAVEWEQAAHDASVREYLAAVAADNARKAQDAGRVNRGGKRSGSQTGKIRPRSGHSGALPPASVQKCESGGDYQAENPSPKSSASGGWQITDGTWDGYGGYDHAADAPRDVQDERARQLWNGGKGASHWASCL